ncbi:hypothetical protein GGR51DRAFT_562674 [Nemania sp. FL0031]|nr:hypothetical protein GGR51DRAFT_562674 [Nemania sp. FL0031]
MLNVVQIQVLRVVGGVGFVALGVGGGCAHGEQTAPARELRATVGPPLRICWIRSWFRRWIWGKEGTWGAGMRRWARGKDRTAYIKPSSLTIRMKRSTAGHDARWVLSCRIKILTSLVRLSKPPTPLFPDNRAAWYRCLRVYRNSAFLEISSIHITLAILRSGRAQRK